MIGMFLLPDIISSPPAQVSVLPSNKIVELGETFELAVQIYPMDSYIAGAQLNIAFNRDLLNVNKITEGNLFKQNGANTIFNSGVLDNSNGTVTNIYCAIMGKSNVSNPGTIIMINLTVINSTGSSGINISNVLISDPDGHFIAVNVTNGTINTQMSATVIPEIRFINGTVMDSINKMGISGVTVSTNTSLYTTTNASGIYSIEVTEGTYDLMAVFEPKFYVNYTANVSTIGSAVMVQDIEFVKKPTGTITGTVTNY
jgi:hypothetical protein